MMNLKHGFTIAIVILVCSEAFCQGNGRIHQHTIASDTLGETRVITVATPAGYAHAQHHYPVLYVLDGEYVFSYAKGTVDFLSNAFGYLPQMIVVGIPNTDRSRDLFVSLQPDGGYVHFSAFIEHELMPFINKQYRANGFDVLYGWSSGSGIGSYLFSTNPDLFDGYIQSGTGIGTRMAAFMSERMANKTYENSYLYAHTESQGPRVSMLERYEALFENMKPEGVRWKFVVDEHASHVEVLSKGLYDGLNFIFSDFYIPDSVTVNGSEAIRSYYRTIDRHYHFDVTIPIGAINESASTLLHNEMPEEAIKLLLYSITLHPTSADLHGTLGAVYTHLDNKAQAAHYYRMAKARSHDNIADYLKYKTLLMQVENGSG